MSNLSNPQSTAANEPTWAQPEGASFEDWMGSRIARFSTRRYDWDALKFQADYDPKFRRAQMRYVGTGGTGVSTDMNTVPSENFTFSTMVIPAGHEGPRARRLAGRAPPDGGRAAGAAVSGWQLQRPVCGTPCV